MTTGNYEGFFWQRSWGKLPSPHQTSCIDGVVQSLKEGRSTVKAQHSPQPLAGHTLTYVCVSSCRSLYLKPRAEFPWGTSAKTSFWGGARRETHKGNLPPPRLSVQCVSTTSFCLPCFLCVSPSPPGSGNLPETFDQSSIYSETSVLTWPPTGAPFRGDDWSGRVQHCSDFRQLLILTPQEVTAGLTLSCLACCFNQIFQLLQHLAAWLSLSLSWAPDTTVC